MPNRNHHWCKKSMMRMSICATVNENSVEAGCGTKCEHERFSFGGSGRDVRKRGDVFAFLHLQEMSVMVHDVFAGQRNSSLRRRGRMLRP